MKRLTGLDWPLWASAVCLLALSLAGAVAITHFDDPNVGFVLLLQSVPYAVAAWLVVCGKPDAATGGRALASILIVGLAMRLLLLPGTPISTDIFRYIWDGRVQAAGINPYLYLPSDAALTGLRDSAIYPYINRADYAPTIYPPASQMIFYLVTRISEAPVAMKAAMVAFEGVAVWAILQLLAARGLPRSRVLLYAWHPLPLWEFARSGHIDIAAIALLLLAFLAMERRSPILAGMALGAGVLVKYFPVVTGPALYKRWDWRFPDCVHRDRRRSISALCRRGDARCSVSSAAISPKRASTRVQVFSSGSFSARSSRCSASAFVFYVAAAVTLMAVLALLVVMRDRKPDADLAGAMLLAVTFTLLFSPHYAWYFAWLVPFLCFYPVVGVIYLTCACSYLYFAHWPPTLSEGLPIYGPCILILIAEFVVRGRRKLETRHADPIAA